MKIFLAAFFGAAVSALAFDGTVHNGTANQPQAAATVSLFRITQNGPEMLASVKSAADGSWAITPPAGTDTPGPKLLQAVYQGVTYNRMVPPGTPTSNLAIEVYDASTKSGAAKVTTHMLLLEPVNGRLSVSESFVYANASKVTFNDPDHGTLRFYVPAAAGGKMEVSVIAPNSVPVRRAADATAQVGVYKLDFPVKPGESRIDLSYQMPFQTPGAFTSKVLYSQPNTKVLAPSGVTLVGAGLQNVGQEPRTKANIYNFDGADLRFDVQGSGALARAGSSGNDSPESAQGSDADDSGSSLAQLLPQLYDKTNPGAGLAAALWPVRGVLAIVLGMLGLGFAYLYRKPTPDRQPTPGRKPAPDRKSAPASHERRS